MQQKIDQILEFWFKSAHPQEMLSHRKEWWVKDDAFDQLIHEKFVSLYEEAAQGALDHWQQEPLGCLALVIVLDQFPRNMFRNQAKSFASDEKARTISLHILDKGWDKDLPIGARLFAYLPLEHSEDLSDQGTCVELMEELGDPDYALFAIKHRNIIERFGRFPHRNEILGRTSTPEEIAFLKEPGSRF